MQGHFLKIVTGRLERPVNEALRIHIIPRELNGKLAVKPSV
jgi:hypothetical protein